MLRGDFARGPEIRPGGELQIAAAHPTCDDSHFSGVVSISHAPIRLDREWMPLKPL